jgi:hypothetical protein
VTEFVLLGVGAMRSPRFRPAGMLLRWGRSRVVFDGGPGGQPDTRVNAWLVTDTRAELVREIRALARRAGVTPAVAEYSAAHGRRRLSVTPLPVVHTSHPTYGYLIRYGRARVVWAPEFWEFPDWAAGADLMFADAAGWARPIRFAGGVGGHASVLASAERARELGIRRLVFAHIGRPAIRAMDDRHHPPYGEWGVEGRCYRPS